MDSMERLVQSGIRPPYGPAKGMIEGLQLMQRISPTRVDEALLRAHGIAPHNEYKVVGALRFLGLIDDQGTPTAKSRLLKTKGAPFKLHLQDIVRAAYAPLFRAVPPPSATREKIYNFFVTEVGLAGEMATKASRFFVELCRLAEIDLGSVDKPGKSREEPRPRSAQAPGAPEKGKAVPAKRPNRPDRVPSATPVPTFNSPLMLAITPELAAMSEEQMYLLFGKLMRAMRRVIEDLEDELRKE